MNNALTPKHTIDTDTPTIYAMDHGTCLEAIEAAAELSKSKNGALVCLVAGDADELFESCEAPPVEIDGAVVYWGVDMDGVQLRVAVPS